MSCSLKLHKDNLEDLDIISKFSTIKDKQKLLSYSRATMNAYNNKHGMVDHLGTPFTVTYLGRGKEKVVFNKIFFEAIDQLENAVFFKENALNEQIKPQEVLIKEGVDSIFEQHPELSNIGSQEEYSAYLDSVFPESKVRDIVYHGTDKEFDNFDINTSGEKTGWGKEFKGIHFFENKSSAETYFNNKSSSDEKGDVLIFWLTQHKLGKKNEILNEEEFQAIEEKVQDYYIDILDEHNLRHASSPFSYEEYVDMYNKYGNNERLNTEYSDEIDLDSFVNDKNIMMTSILNIKNPLTHDSKGQRYVSEVKDVYSKLNNENDGIVVKNTLDRLNDRIGIQDTVDVVFNTEQIHILGSKQDIEGFNDFIENISSPESISSQEQAQTMQEVYSKIDAMLESNEITITCKI